MKKRFKFAVKVGKVYILRWQSDGTLFGAQWEAISFFDEAPGNRERCRKIVRLMNECDQITNNITENDHK